MPKPNRANEQDKYLLDLKRKFMRAQDICEPARKESAIDEGYYEGPGQWTDAERQTLQSRGQPDIYDNYVRPAVNGVIGILERGRTDPKAWGRTPHDTDAGDVATDALRFVCDTTRFQSKRGQALRDYFVPGICVGIVEVGEDRDPVFRKGRPEEFFYDPYSREADFSDARYLGLAKWMDEVDALALTDDEKIKKAISSGIDANGLFVTDTHEDRPKGWTWADDKTRRVMVIDMYHRQNGEWYRCLFTGSVVIQSGPSEYKDDKGRSVCNIMAVSCYVDQENRRSGIVRDMRGPQDGINKQTTKILHILTSRQVRVDPGIMDADDVRRQAARPDGVFEYRKDQFEFVGDRDVAAPHIEMLQQSKMHMQRVSPTPSIVGRQSQGQSGRAILAEQQAGMTEMALLFGQFDDWTLRIYRMMWYCIRQYWTEQRYIRVTDDEMAPKYVMMNEPVFDPMTGQPAIDPRTGQAMVKNSPALMDVDIIIDSQPDTAVLQEEQFQKLVELTGLAVQSGAMDKLPTLFDAIIEASSIPRKKQVLDKLRNPQQPSPQQQAAQELQMRGAVAEVTEKEAKANLTHAQAVKTEQEARMVGVEPQLRMAEHQQEMQMQREEFGQEMQMRQADHAMTMQQKAQDSQLAAAQGVQQLRQGAMLGEQKLRLGEQAAQQKARMAQQQQQNKRAGKGTR